MSGSLCVIQTRLCVCGGTSAFCVSELERDRERAEPKIIAVSIWLASYANEYKELFLQPGGRELSPVRLRG